MITEELILMLGKFEEFTGKTPAKILFGEAAFEKIRRETTDFVSPNGFERYYYGQWNTAVQNEEEFADISEDDYMSILNGGGFNAVTKR